MGVGHDRGAISSLGWEYAMSEGVAKAWVAMHLSERGSSEFMDNFWAYEVLSNLCIREPSSALLLIGDIVFENPGDVILSNLAAGPLEDLLVRHGDVVIEDIVAAAKTNELWKKMLGAVWKNDIKDHVWLQLKSVAGPSW